MILAIHGDNQLAVQRRLDALRADVSPGGGDFGGAVTVLDGRTASPGEILAAAMAVPFLSDRRLVLVQGLLGRSLERDKAGWEQFFGALESGLPGTTTLVLTGEPPDPRRRGGRGGAMLTRLRKLGDIEVEEHRLPARRDLPEFVASELSSRGLSHEPAVATMLAERSDGDTMALASEIEKLAVYAGGQRITAGDVQAVGSHDRSSEVWDFTDAVLDGKLATAYRAQRELLARGESVQGIIATLIGLARTLALVADLVEDGLPDAEIASEAGRPLANHWARDRAIRRARRLGPSGVRRIYEVALSIDRQQKRGEIDDDLALDLLVARLGGAGQG